MKINIANKDYLEYLKTLKDKSIDFICIDPPYGKINGMKLSGQKKQVDWDLKINWEKMFKEFSRVIRDGGTIACFGQNPTYAEMIMANYKNYKYEFIWEKNNAAQGFHVDKMPLNFTENIAIFIQNEKKSSKRTFNNIAKLIEINKNEHFLRWYAQQLFSYIGKTRRKIHSELGHRKLEFFFCYTGKHFGMLSEELYKELIQKYKIKKWENFIAYKELKKIWINEKEKTKGIKLDSAIYSKTFSNILKVPKENQYLHPTQKPVELMKKLIRIFSKPKDKILDCFMGSGSTGVAAIELNREFYGSELNKEYYDIAKKRLKKESKK